MFRIPTVLTAAELTAKALRRAAKVTVSGRTAQERKKKTAIAKVTAATQIAAGTLRHYVHVFPSLEKLPTFYRELIEVLVDIDALKKSLGTAQWAAERIEALGKEAIKAIGSRPQSAEQRKAMVYARLASVLKQVAPALQLLNTARDALRKMPLVDTELPTVVVAGFPNVGKSQLVTALSSAKPEIAPYPFTTKGIAIGHMVLDGRAWHVIDTPGLLDRELSKRNKMELQAVLALRHLAKVIIYMLDPTETCGYAVARQETLLEQIRKEFTVPVIVVENKADLLARKNDNLKISSLYRSGLSAVRAALSKLYQVP